MLQKVDRFPNFQVFQFDIPINMDRFKLLKFFVLTAAIHSVKSGLVVSVEKFGYKCDPQYGNLTFFPSTRADYVGGYTLELFRDFENIHFEMNFELPSNNKVLNHEFDLCTLENTHQNIFTQFWFEYLVPAIKDYENLIRCPARKGFYEVGERSVEKFVKSSEAYMPSLVKFLGKVEATFRLFSKVKHQKVAICETNEEWLFQVA